MIASSSLVLLLTASLFSQTRIDGRIVDKSTSEPLVGVNVFFSKTTWGATTDDNGFYTLTNIPAGQYELVVSMIGYEVERENMIIKTDERFTLNFRLQSRAILMSEVNVTAKTDRVWKKNYDRFRRSFLGTSKNGESCLILNEFVLTFDENGQYFRAKASQPIRIENPELGYRITYILDDFEIDGTEVRYAGDHYYESMVSKSKRQLKKWEKNRKKAYNGSLRHLLKTLTDRFDLRFTINNGMVIQNDNWNSIAGRKKDPLVREGFSISMNKKDLFGTSLIIEEEYKPLRSDTLVFPGATYEQPLLSFEGRMMVVYMKESPELAYMMENDSPSSYKQTSYLLLRADSVYYDRDGRFFEPYMIEQQGYSSWERIGDQLPFNYEQE
ncbi:MAG: carboxypeptidase-like regulatory domain-containing protein [Candidatus Neomarinimicrobiota bacterium]|nr:carboxypeptidase-like regulatory domain-containing protein [Candidatus Neomarinimicrobiota bacterium]MED5248335.1 carboxypeptidase-like regulatory domain-containing protein [Candidatus Neomarinimicrobiota bacterium]